jgi:hypothetical protein
MAEAIAPTTQDRIPTTGGIGIKTMPDLGWNTPAPLQVLNQESQQKHITEFAPKADAAIKAMNPAATPEQKLAGANALKAFSGPKNNEDFAGSHDIRWDVVFEPTGGIAGIIRGLNGGSDVREIGRSGDSTPVVTVYNGRGDVRRYESLNGERISPEELKALGPITSIRDISAERAAGYKARGLSAEQIAAAQSRAWQRDLNASDTFSRESDAAIDVFNRLKSLSKEMVPYSTNPATRTIMARIATLTSNKEQQASIARQQLNRLANGEAENDEFNNVNRESGGIMGTFTYQKGKGLTTANGTKVSSETINELSNRIASINSSGDKIQSNAQNLANWAQMTATENKLPIIDKIQELIGLKTQAALIEKRFEDLGGVPGFKGSPNVAHNVTDSFSLSYANAEYGLAQATAAKAYAEYVRQKQQQLGFKTPDIGTVPSEFSNSDLAKVLRQQRTKNVEDFRKEVLPTLEKLSQEPAYKDIEKQISGIAVRPPSLPAMPKDTEISGAKAPTASNKKQKQSNFSAELNAAFPLN